MKKLISPLVSVLLILLMINPVLHAKAAHPTGFWPLLDAYNAAVESGNTDDILKAGDAILRLYTKAPLNKDIAGMSYTIYYYRFTNAVFEQKGDYDAAITNAEKLAYFAEYLGFTDAVIAARARAVKLDPMTEVYALSGDNDTAAYFGATYEPLSGTYYGRVADFSRAHNNAAVLAGEAVVSFYYSVGSPEASVSAAMMKKYDDGSHVVHFALNFPEADGISAQVAGGMYDAELNSLLAEFAAFKCPLLLRIGAEMNLWESDAAAYRGAYRHIAGLIRSAAPNAALVWSPNYVGSWGSDVADYYPGDDVVDWVGLSLYTNSAPMAGQTADDANSSYFGRGAFADCILSLRQLADFASVHGKPVMITEGGTGIINKATGADDTAHAAEQTAKMYSALNMVYPNVKAIVYFDADPAVDTYQYALSNSSDVQSAYTAAVSNNRSLISKAGGTAPSYIKLGGVTETDGQIEMAAYGDTVYSDSMTVTYYLSGQVIASLTELPYRFTMDTALLAPGKQEFKVVFNDGAGFIETKTYTLTKLSSGTVVFSEGYTAAPMDAPSDWAKTEVAAALAAGLVPEALQIKYTANITRADFCRLVINLIAQKTGRPIDETLAQKDLERQYGSFSDTADKNVLAAYALGIVNGRGDRLFDPNAGINREEAAKMLRKTAEILDVKPYGTSPGFLDAASFSSWASDAIAFVTAATDQASGKTVMGGVGGNRFDPKGMYTCQQAYMTMLRLYNAG